MTKNVLTLLLALMPGLSVQTFSQLREYPDESLTGVKGVHVIVRYLAPNESYYGLTEEGLQSAVETRLSVDGVRVLDERAWHKEPGEPYLFINVVGTQVDSVKKSRSTFVYSFSADFIQKVTLSRRPSFTTDGATWSQGYFLVVSQEDLSNVTLKISDVAHDFAESLHKANIREQRKQ